MGSYNPPADFASQELNILLVGPRRTGKSSSGNTLLGQGTVFDTKGGGAGTTASAITAGRYVNIVDAKGWGSSEGLVLREDKLELLRALSLFGLGGPHVILLVIPLLDFTEHDRKAVERMMEVLTPSVWKHTMVLFTLGDQLRGRGQSVEDHIKSGGPDLQWLLEKCRYRYHVFDNKAAVIEKGEQVRELLCKVEDKLLENGGWHFSLHMYQRLEEEWNRRELELRARLEAERTPQPDKNPEQSPRLETRENSTREEQQYVEEEMNRGEEKEDRVMVRLQRQSSEESKQRRSERRRC